MTLDRKQHEKLLDKLCRDVVFARDKARCVFCARDWHQTQLQWAHIHTRGWKSLRWDTDNSVTMCAKCHMLWHGILPGEETSMRDAWKHLFPQRAQRMNIALKTRHKIDLALIEVHLRGYYKELTGRDWVPV